MEGKSPPQKGRVLRTVLGGPLQSSVYRIGMGRMAICPPPGSGLGNEGGAAGKLSAGERPNWGRPGNGRRSSRARSGGRHCPARFWLPSLARRSIIPSAKLFQLGKAMESGAKTIAELTANWPGQICRKCKCAADLGRAKTILGQIAWPDFGTWEWHWSATIPVASWVEIIKNLLQFHAANNGKIPVAFPLGHMV